MKVLIWIGTLFVATLLNVLLGEAIGFRAGGLLLYDVVYFVAKKLCDMWDASHPKEDPGSVRYCKGCGAKLDGDTKFCRACGKPVE